MTSPAAISVRIQLAAVYTHLPVGYRKFVLCSGNIESVLWMCCVYCAGTRRGSLHGGEQSGGARRYVERSAAAVSLVELGLLLVLLPQWWARGSAACGPIHSKDWWLLGTLPDAVVHSVIASSWRCVWAYEEGTRGEWMSWWGWELAFVAATVCVCACVRVLAQCNSF